MSAPSSSRTPAWERFLGWLSRHRAAFFRYVAPVLQRTRLSLVIFRGYERAMSLGERGGTEPADDGLPVPSAHLRVLVNGTPSREGFLTSGRAGADSIAQAFSQSGQDIGASGALLDFGCGCGRILRHWRDLEGVEVFGCDYNPRLADWAARHLPHASATRNGLAPPAPFPDERFGAIYAISVFTHFSPELQTAWMADLVRMLRPGGRLLFTTHGEPMATVLLPEERARFDRGELVVRFDDETGSNLCNAFHPEAWVRTTLTQGLDVQVFRPGGDDGLGRQDIWVVRKP
jgi:SAM-dependent methyltransferase